MPTEDFFALYMPDVLPAFWDGWRQYINALALGLWHGTCTLYMKEGDGGWIWHTVGEFHEQFSLVS